MTSTERAALSDPCADADRWGEMQGPRGGIAWHRFRHVPSNSGGTYGWWPVCRRHVSQHVGPRAGQEPGKGDKVCRRCRKDGPAEWEMQPQASDWIGAATGFSL